MRRKRRERELRKSGVLKKERRERGRDRRANGIREIRVGAPAFLKWIFIGAGAMILTAGLAFGIATLIMYNKPISTGYTLSAAKNAYIFHVGDSVSARCSFEEATDRKYLLHLQGLKKKKLIYSSSDETVATVDESGFIQAVGAGSAVITAQVSDDVQKIIITSYVPAEAIGFEEEEYSMNCGEEIDLAAVLSPSDAVLFDTVRYKSMNEDIATIDENGHVTALNPGTARIIVSADDVIGSATIEVYQPMTGIELADLADGELITMERGSTHQFSINYFPENTTDDRTITWTLSDPEAGTVDDDMVYTATGREYVTLTATCGPFSDSVDLYIKVTLTDILLDHDTCALTYLQQDCMTFSTVPADVTDGINAVWTSENTNVVTVDGSGVVTAVGGGTTDVVLNVNGFEKRCTYTVTVPITGVSISTGGVSLYTGDVTRISAAVTPSFTTEEDKSITWSSDNPGIATVDGSGLITTVSAGTTVIRATHGAFQAACTVTVVDRPSWVDISNAIISYGEQFIGTPYVYGGNSLTGGIDCSAFTQKCFATQGIALARTSYNQVNQGDLIFYSKNGRVYHVAIYIGNGQILQSSESQGGVCISAYNYNGMTPTYVRRYF